MQINSAFKMANTTQSAAQMYRKKDGNTPWEKVATTHNYTKTVDGDISPEYKGFTTSIGADAPDSVWEAWDKASKTVGADGLGMNSEGKLSFVGEMRIKYWAESFVERYNFEQKYGLPAPKDYKNPDHGLGTTVQSAKDFVLECMYSLEHPDPRNYRSSTASQRDMEKKFYEEFLANLNKIS